MTKKIIIYLCITMNNWTSLANARPYISESGDSVSENSAVTVQANPKRSDWKSSLSRFSLWDNNKKKTDNSSLLKTQSTSIEQSLPYNYFDEQFIKSVISDGSRFVLVGTGWSESSLGKMGVNNQEKQKRAVALSLSQMMKIEQLGGKGRLIYLSTSPISPAYRRYLYGIANRSMLEPLSEEQKEARYQSFEGRFLRVVYLSPKGRDKTDVNRTQYLKSNSNAYRRIKLPKALVSLHHDKYISNKIVGFTAHFSGPYLEDIAKEWKLPYLVNPSAHAHQIKKSKSRQSFRNAGIRHPRGTYEPAFTKEALVDDIYNLLSQIDGKKIILKLDQSAAGYGNKVMRLDEIRDDMDETTAKKLIMQRFNDQEIFPPHFVKRIEEIDGGAIIEEFIDCKNYASPASVYMINGENSVTLQYAYDQLLGGLDNMVFQGSLGPISMPPNEEGNIGKMSEQVGLQLSREGVRGNVGTDFVTCDMDEKGERRIAYAIENNVRMTGTSYPYYTIRTLVGTERMKNKFMKSFDDVKIPKVTIKAPRENLNRVFYSVFLKNHPDSLNVKTGNGCLVHNDTFRIGKLGIACVADSKEAVIKLYDSFMKSMQNFLENHEIYEEYKHSHVTEEENTNT